MTSLAPLARLVPPSSAPVAQILTIESATTLPLGSIVATVTLDSATPPGGTTRPSTMRLVGNVLGQPVDETRTAPVDARERELMAAVRQAFEGADLIGRSTQLEDAQLPPLAPGVVRISFTGTQSEGRYIDLAPATASPAESAFGDALVKYGNHAFPAV